MRNAAASGNRKYLKEIDICKGFACILVVFGHALKQTGEGNLVFDGLLTLIYGFHMPLFFFLSGLVSFGILELCGWKEKRDYVKKRAFRLLVPYFTVGVIYMPVKYILSDYAVNEYNYSEMWRILLGENPNASLWFLYVLFLISAFCVCFLNKRNLRFWLLATLVLSAVSYTAALGVPLRLLKYCFFFVLGIYVRSNYESIISTLVHAGFVWVSAFIFILVNVGMIFLKWSGLSFLAAFSGAICSFLAAVSFSKKDAGVIRTLAFLGQYCMDIYILSEPVITVVKLLSWNLLHMNYMLCSLLCFAGGIMVPVPVSKYIIRRVKIFRAAFLGEK